jgi:hypothetical protein
MSVSREAGKAIPAGFRRQPLRAGRLSPRLLSPTRAFMRRLTVDAGAGPGRRGEDTTMTRTTRRAELRRTASRMERAIARGSVEEQERSIREYDRAPGEAALDSLRRFRALRCGDALVVDDRGHEILTLTADARGITSAHAVDDRFTRVAGAINDAEIPFAQVRCSGDVAPAPQGPYDAAGVADELARRGRGAMLPRGARS